jgi:hypothetical protein
LLADQTIYKRHLEKSRERSISANERRLSNDIFGVKRGSTMVETWTKLKIENSMAAKLL